MSNKRTGWEICQEMLNAQDLINAQAIDKTNMTYKVKKCTVSNKLAQDRFFFLKINKRTCTAIRQARVSSLFLQLSLRATLAGSK